MRLMTSINAYDQAYIAGHRARMAEQMATYQALRLAALGPAQDGEADVLDLAFNAFEHDVFANLVLVLDRLFDERVQGREGGAIDEVRRLSAALLDNDRVRMDAAGFDRLQKAFFAEVESRCARP